MRRTILAAMAGLSLVSAAAAQEAPPATTAGQMLAEARELAGGDTALLAEVEAAQAEASRGVLGSTTAVAVRQTIPGGASWSMALARRAGEPLVIAVRRVGDAPVMLRVVDAEGKQICADATGSATLACRVAPGNGALSVKVVNPGSQPAEALLLTN